METFAYAFNLGFQPNPTTQHGSNKGVFHMIPNTTIDMLQHNLEKNTNPKKYSSSSSGPSYHIFI